MTLKSDNKVKRKAVSEDVQFNEARHTKMSKKDGELFDFDQVSNFAAEPPIEDDVLLDKEVNKVKNKLGTTNKVTNVSIKTEILDQSEVNIPTNTNNSQDSQSLYEKSVILDNLLLDNLLMSDEDDDDEQHDQDFYRDKLLSTTLRSKCKKPIDKAQDVIYLALRSKNEELESLKTQIVLMKKEFDSKVKIKKEVLDTGLEKNNLEMKNINEEQEYLIEEIKVKDAELLKRENELKDKAAAIKECHNKLTKSEKLNQDLQKTVNEKEKIIGRLEEKILRLDSKISWFSKKKPVKSDIENRLMKAEEEVEKIVDEKQNLIKTLDSKDDEIAKLEEQKYFLENNLLERQLELKKKDEQKMYLDKEYKEQNSHYERKITEALDEIKNLTADISKESEDNKEKTCKIMELETNLSKCQANLSKSESLLKTIKEKNAVKFRQMSEAAKVADEYKIDLESRIQELDAAVKRSKDENNTIIMEDLKVIENGRNQMEELKSKIEILEANADVLHREKDAINERLASKVQDQISLEIKASEKDELIFVKNKSIEKLNKKVDKLKNKIVEISELKDGLDNRITITEMKYFNLEKELSSKQAQMKELSDKHNEKIKELREEGEKMKTEMDAKLKKTKSYLLQQVSLIKKKSGDKINLSTEEIIL